MFFIQQHLFQNSILNRGLIAQESCNSFRFAAKGSLLTKCIRLKSATSATSTHLNIQCFKIGQRKTTSGILDWLYFSTYFSRRPVSDEGRNGSFRTLSVRHDSELGLLGSCLKYEAMTGINDKRRSGHPT